ncbi:recombinase XerD [Deinococcus sp. SDU3-2]|uniref:Recombinase XerD n=1 Tax=Deinococcus terrestris TaxID=2651870 RepID=A0A7X1TT73_9DEIO|nr:recombinase XerD [Deinococcus terrestris]MPY68112.1 recombinase XerD [Deinococcus terrestris]
MKTAEQAKVLTALFRDPRTPPAERPLLIARHLGLVGDSLTKQDIAFLSNLRPFFEHAEETGTDLLHPPEDFHGWLAVPLTLSRKAGVSRISNNTYNARATALSRLYAALRQQGAVRYNPVHDLPRRKPEQSGTKLPGAGELQVLRDALGRKREPHTLALFLLIYRLGFTAQAVFELRWDALDLTAGTVRRGEVLSRLPADMRGVLLRLRTPDPLLVDPTVRPRRGGESPNRQDHVFPGLHEVDEVREFLWQATGFGRGTAGGAVVPSTLRLAGLRDAQLEGDLGEQARQFGYRDVVAFHKARENARARQSRLT